MTDTMDAPAPAPFPITQVEAMIRWFEIGRGERTRDLVMTVRFPVHLRSMTSTVDGHCGFSITVSASLVNDPNAVHLAVLRHLYDTKVGHTGCYWYGHRHGNVASVTIPYIADPIEFKYANIKWGDLFDFYTTDDGVLRLPPWKHIKYAMDEFLAEDPRIKYHPSRVQQFIQENGIDNLEAME